MENVLALFLGALCALGGSLLAQHNYLALKSEIKDKNLLHDVANFLRHSLKDIQSTCPLSNDDVIALEDYAARIESKKYRPFAEKLWNLTGDGPSQTWGDCAALWEEIRKVLNPNFNDAEDQGK